MKTQRTMPSLTRIEGCRVAAFRIPTDAPESDGTYKWDATTLVVVELSAADEIGLGYTYSNAATAHTITENLESIVIGADVFSVEQLWQNCFAQLRNLGRGGISAMAVSAIDVAAWDLKAKLLGAPLVSVLGQLHEALPVYGSGGFTSYSNAQLRAQFEAWQAAGIYRFKMKVGRDLAADPQRVRAARGVIGNDAELFVDANSAYTRAQARHFAQLFAMDFGVRWLEEPFLPEDFASMNFLRQHAPENLEIAEGEYGYNLDYFHHLFSAHAVDVAMADITRCGGITGFLKISALCETWRMPLSTHCAPALCVHPGCASGPLRHAEYFHDHERIERTLFDGVPPLRDGALQPDLSVPGHGLTFKWADAQRYAV